MATLVEWELGVHLNQRHTDYLQDHGLGYSSIKSLFLNAIEWWNDSPHNPLRPEADDDVLKTTKRAFLRGEALHAYVLDGPRVYDRGFGARPTRRSHPDFLDSVEELKAACRKHGLDWRGLKGDLIHNLVKANAPEKILAVEQAAFDRSGKKVVTEDDDIRIRLLHRMMMRTSAELKLEDGSTTIADLLKNCLTEVSVYWIDENGIRQRARFDILKPAVTGDLKSITQWKKSNFTGELLKEIIFRGYMIQVAHYHEARKALRQAVAEGRVFGGNKTQRKLLERIARSDHWGWAFVFAKMDGAPQVKSIVIRPDKSNQFDKAVRQRSEAIANFLFYREFHGGLDKPWFDPDVVWEPSEVDWPAFGELGQ